MDIRKPPRIIIVEDDAYRANPKTSGTVAMAHQLTNSVILPDYIAKAIERSNDLADYVFCHEMGHAADFNRGTISRRDFVLGSIATMHVATLGGGYAAGKWANNALPDGTGKALRIPTVAGAGLTGALAARNIAGYIPARAISLLSPSDEQAAEEGAAKILGFDTVLKHMVTTARLNIDLSQQLDDKTRDKITACRPMLEARLTKVWPSHLPLSADEREALIRQHVTRNGLQHINPWAMNPLRNGNYPTTLETLEALSLAKTPQHTR